ncbi:MAG: CaiB/BaiF CoA-transferase family protein, partial [Burkholderiaceae bacterium]
NRNKRSLAIDIATAVGAAAVRELAGKADILVENFKVDGLRKYGLDYETLKTINPRLIYCSITGFGQDGPYAHKLGYDFVIQAVGGLMSITGERDDLPGGGAQKAGNAAADLMAGMFATTSVLAALHERTRSGKGQHIDISMLDCQVAALGVQNFNYFLSGKVPGRAGNAHANMVPYQVFDVADGQIVLAIGNDSQYRKFCMTVDRPDLVEHDDYRTNSARVVNRERLVPLVAEILRQRGREEWRDLLDRAGVPVGLINDVEQVFDDPQVRARGVRFSMDHPIHGPLPQVRSPMRFSDSPVRYRKAPPLIGEHTAEVLREQLGYTNEQIEALVGVLNEVSS